MGVDVNKRQLHQWVVSQTKMILITNKKNSFHEDLLIACMQNICTPRVQADGCED